MSLKYGIVIALVMAIGGCESQQTSKKPAKDASKTSTPASETKNTTPDAKQTIPAKEMTAATPTTPTTPANTTTPTKTAAGNLTVPAQPAQPVAATGAPKLACDKPTYHFEPVWAGAQISDKFIIRNDGGSLLKIFEVKPHCSCTVPSEFTREIPPGQTGQVPFTLNTTNKTGDTQEFVTLKTNDPTQESVVLWVKGLVKTVCRLEVIDDSSLHDKKLTPEDVDQVKKSQGYFGRIKTDDHLYRVIKLINSTGQPLSLEVTGMMPPNSPFRASIQETVPQQEFELTISADPPFPVGDTYANIMLRTNIPDKMTHYIPIAAYVPPRVEVVPYRIVADQQSYTIKNRKITITNNGDTPFKITSVACTDPTYDVALMPPDPTKPHDMVVSVTLPPGGYRPPPYGEMVRIETTDSEKGVIELLVLPELRQEATPRPADKPIKYYPGRM